MFISRADVKKKMRRKYDEVFCHDGSEKADPDAVDDAVAYANGEIYALINRKGFNDSKIRIIAESKEPTLVAAGCWIAADYGALQKTEFVEEGKSTYDSLAVKARKTIDELVDQRRRLEAERETGTPETARSLNTDPAPRPKFYMAPTKDRPLGPGGF